MAFLGVGSRVLAPGNYREDSPVIPVTHIHVEVGSSALVKRRTFPFHHHHAKKEKVRNKPRNPPEV